jgi:predicted cupin superfamily sugar epimerase
MVEAPTAADIIARLELKPHPEGGYYRETFRDVSLDAGGRARSTAIYVLLARGERSHLHRIDAVEIWHYYAGPCSDAQWRPDLSLPDSNWRRKTGSLKAEPASSSGPLPR